MTNAHGARCSLAQLNTRGLHMFRDEAAWMSALGQKQTFSVGGTYSLMETESKPDVMLLTSTLLRFVGWTLRPNRRKLSSSPTAARPGVGG